MKRLLQLDQNVTSLETRTADKQKTVAATSETKSTTAGHHAAWKSFSKPCRTFLTKNSSAVVCPDQSSVIVQQQMEAEDFFIKLKQGSSLTVSPSNLRLWIFERVWVFAFFMFHILHLWQQESFLTVCWSLKRSSSLSSWKLSIWDIDLDKN